jgi:hypothetical protein
MFSQYPGLGHSAPRCDTFNPSPPAEFGSGSRPVAAPRVPVPALRAPEPGPVVDPGWRVADVEDVLRAGVFGSLDTVDGVFG